MKLETKFNIGDPVIIKGQRYKVSKFSIEIRKDAFTEEVKAIILVYGDKKVKELTDCTIGVGDVAEESDVVADPLA